MTINLFVNQKKQYYTHFLIKKLIIRTPLLVWFTVLVTVEHPLCGTKSSVLIAMFINNMLIYKRNERKRKGN